MAKKKPGQNSLQKIKPEVPNTKNNVVPSMAASTSTRVGHMNDVVHIENDDVHDVEDACGYCLDSYVTGCFRDTKALLKLCDLWKAEHTLQHNTHADRIVQNSLKNGELQQDLQEGAPLIQFVNKKKGNNLPIEKPKVVQ
ncbi:Hypothetical predicted protein [Olea europaea subsp. europaea]|uniref:Uncharacterized protein n=1 Tax=Olea europaea subsp. europaea TaxID=158383 RepID=A0A8S0V4N3_OLEEU|nr:Hypothetical predicted protein [Olea europaea subsp. europaea]